MNLGMRLLGGILRVLSAIFNIPVKLKYMVLFLILVGGGTYWYTYKQMLESVGGKNEFDEAMRYIEIKDVVENEYIDVADRESMGSNAAAAMISGLGDKWSYYMSPNEYKAYQLNSANEYTGIGMSILKEEGGGFEVISVNMDSPAAWAGLTPGDIITSVDGQDLRGLTLDEARKLIRSKLNGKFELGIGKGKQTIEVDCTGVYQSSVSYRLEKTLAGYIQIKNFEAGTAQDAINAVEELLNQGAVALCIDLRGNAGGLDTEVADFLDYLLPSGTLERRGRRHERQLRAIRGEERRPLFAYPRWAHGRADDRQDKDPGDDRALGRQRDPSFNRELCDRQWRGYQCRRRRRTGVYYSQQRPQRHRHHCRYYG